VRVVRMGAVAGLPQFDTSHFTSQVFWEIICFLLLLFLLQRFVLPRINAVLDERSARIRRALEGAEDKRRKAEAALREYRRKLDTAHSEAEKVLQAARKEAESIRATAMIELQAEIRRKKERAFEEIAYAERRAKQEIKGVCVDLAVAAAEKLIRREMDRESAEELIEEAIRDLNRRS